MDIEAFYDADPRRRASDELEFGRDWHDQTGNRYELSWVELTGELYTMREPIADGGWVDSFGDVIAPSHSGALPPGSVTAHVLAIEPERGQVEAILQGWETAMAQPDSMSWVLQRLRMAGTPGPVAEANHSAVRQETQATEQRMQPPL